MRLNAQPENAFPKGQAAPYAEGGRGTNIGKGKTIDITGGRLPETQTAAFYLIQTIEMEN